MNFRKRTIVAAAVALFFSSLGFTGTAAAADSSALDASAGSSSRAAAAKGDPLLEALLAELERSTAKLKMDQVQAPYYIEYSVNDVENFSAEATFGAIRQNDLTHRRVLRVVVRIGDYKQDSYYKQGVGSASYLPLEDDPIALRRQIWLLTDEAYKGAADAYADKLSALKQLSADPNPVDDFARAPVVSIVDEPVKLKVNRGDWTKTLEDVTGLYRDYPEVQAVSAQANFEAVNEYFVNSEGTVIRRGQTTATVTLNGSTQAEDGMFLSRNPFWTEVKPEDLPSRDNLLKESKQMLDTLRALRAAPVVEESYRGPVLFAPDAANDVVSSLLAVNIVGRKPALGRPNRTTGSFATSYKTRVLPKFATLIDDPTLKQADGKALVGSYDVDSEGVKSQQVTLIKDGMLENYLTGRQPLRDFPSSNGHGRANAGGLPIPSIGVLLLKSSEPQSSTALVDSLKHIASEQSKPYAYRVDTLGPGNTPRLLYRVYVSDGHEELVRGAVFNELDVRTLRNDLSAIGDQPLVSNRGMAGVPHTIICPALLFDELEVKRADTTKEKLPEYPAPAIK
ncbi:MAG TPA: metallopeptidase TldD-related protein [Dongiaceae bacterium]|nr:metallopeptidase TldD-related protein [Dongiaceae bacterium]